MNLAKFSEIFDKKKTFRPKKKFQPGTMKYSLHKQAQASLNSGINLRQVVKLPKGEDFNDWLAVHVVDFFNRINLIYGTVCEQCTRESCPTMSGGAKFEYLWQDGTKYKKPTHLPAPQYISLLMDWVESQINDEASFQPQCKKILTRLYRVFVHVYVHHFDRIMSIGAEPHVNTCYKHFYYFVTEFELINEKEFAPLQEMTRKICTDIIAPPTPTDGVSSSSVMAGTSWSMARVTDLLTSTAEISTLVSVLTVLAGLLVMLVFLIKLIYQDIADGGGGGVTKVNVRSPQTAMTRVEVPFTLALVPGPSAGSGAAAVVRVSARTPYCLTHCWAVPISAFHHALRAPWPQFYAAAVSRDPARDVFGGKQRSSVAQPHEERDISLQCPEGALRDLGAAPREVYPLVVMLVKLGSEAAEDMAEVTALVAIVHLRDAACPIPSQVLATYIRQGRGLTQLRPLYVAEAEGGAGTECSDTESAEDSDTEDTAGGGQRLLARCVVCQIGRVNRVALPCRHAATCATCFERLQSRCPMCRGLISSHFLLFPDPAPAPAPPSHPAPASPQLPRSRWRQWSERVTTALGLAQN